MYKLHILRRALESLLITSLRPSKTHAYSTLATCLPLGNWGDVLFKGENN